MLKQLVGIGLRHPHIEQFAVEHPSVGWVEVHVENYMSLGGPAFEKLLEIRKDYPVSLHGIGMSLGSADGLDDRHLEQVQNLVNAVDPFLVSDHLSWSSTGNHFLPELLPAPLNTEVLEVFARNICKAQEKLQRQILLENPSTYFEFTDSTYSEPEFLNILARKTGAGILLDVNNIYTSSLNNGWSSEQYITDINPKCVKEIHLAGYSEKPIDSGEILYIDSHDNPVSEAVWRLYRQTLLKLGQVPTLIEWDVNIPKLEILLGEAQKADLYMKNATEEVYA